MRIDDVTFVRAGEFDGLLDGALCRLLPRVPLPEIEQLPRPAALLLGPRCAAWLELAASDARLVCLVVVGADEDAPDDERIDDVVTSLVTATELGMRARRALVRKRALATRDEPRADLDGVRWRGRFAPLSATEARLAARLLAQPGAVISTDELAGAAFEGAAGTRRALQAHLYRLRKKLRPLAGLEIQAVRQRGFRAVLLGESPDG